jgi:RsiW-degrading membrane proteinase PrsW (M82 family)
MFIAAGLVEETLKYLPIAYARNDSGGMTPDRHISQ